MPMYATTIINTRMVYNHVKLTFIILSGMAAYTCAFQIGLKETVPSLSRPNYNRQRQYTSLAFISTQSVHRQSKDCPLDSLFRRSQLYAKQSKSTNNDDSMDQDDYEDDFGAATLPDEIETPLEKDLVESLTTTQLKQQLRLRGLKVSGRKADLVERLLEFGSSSSPFGSGSENTKKSKAQKFAEEKGKEFIDVTAYLDEEDVGKQTKSSTIGNKDSVNDNDVDDDASTTLSEPEVWGVDAQIVEDYEGRQLIVDGLSRTIIEYKGSNQTLVQAFVVATRDALKPFLAGGKGRKLGDTAKADFSNINSTKTEAEKRLYEIQSRREKAAQKPLRFDDESGLDEGDENGIFNNVLNRDFSDWGVYTPTGAQLSAAEVQGVLLLSDVYGPFTNYTQALAEKIAFECQPVVVMVPDLFRGDPWTGPTTLDDAKGRSYEEWRATHSDLRISVDVRAAAACLRERYGVSCIAVWGTCFGGGRALEAASGVLPSDSVHDIDGNIGPPVVDPVVAIAWYPTRYDLDSLFGKHHKGTTETMNREKRQLAVMGVFAEHDKIPGATAEDALKLKSALELDDRVNDHIVKVFPGQNHGFAHLHLLKQEPIDPHERFVDEEFGGAGRVTLDGGDAEIACLLSTSFMETYSRVFLPTVGPPISKDQGETFWGGSVELESFEDRPNRDVRQEIEDALDNFVEEPLGGYRIDPTDKSQEEELKKLLISMQDSTMKDGPFAIEDDDDLATVYAKLTSADKNFQIF